MAGPWEKYQQSAPQGGEEGPWNKYRAATPDTPAAEAPAPEPTWLDTIMGYADPIAHAAGYTGQEFRRGMTQMAGAPVDLINMSPMLGNLLPGEQGLEPFSENPVGGSEFLWALQQEGLDPVGIEEVEPENRTERMLGRVAEEVGAAALPVAGTVAAGQRVGTQAARQMQRSARPGERFMGRTLESATVSPGKFAAKEGKYATAAGVGSAAATEAVRDDDPDTTSEAELIADILGALGGAGSLAGASALWSNAGDVFNAVFRPEQFAKRMAREEAANTIGLAANAPKTPSGAIDTAPVSQAIRTGRRIGDVIPGFQDTTSDVMQTPGLAELEFSRQMGPSAGPFKQRRAANQQAADETLTDLGPDGQPGKFSGALVDERAHMEQELQNYFNDIESQASVADANLQPSTTSEARGQTTRGALDTARDNARAAEREAWEAVKGTADPAPLADAFDRVTDGLTTARRRSVDDMGPAVSTPRDLIPGDGGQVNLDEITSLRSEFTDAIRTARANNQSGRANVLQQYVDAIDTYLDSAPEVGDALANARAVSKDFNDRFTRRGDPIADSLATNPSGGPAVPDSSVTGKFIADDSGQAVNVDKLLRETENATEVRGALQDQILDDVRKKGLLDKPDRLETYLGQYSRVFEKFPDLKEDLGTAAGLRRQLQDAEGQMAAQQRDLFSRSGGPVGRYLSYGDERAVDAMNTVLKSRDPAGAMDELLSFVDDGPEAVKGAQAAFWDALKAKTKSTGASTRTPDGGQSWRFNAVAEFVEDPANAAVMERLYRDNPEHLANIREVAASLKRADFSQTGRAAGSSGTPQGALKGSMPSAESVGSRIFAVKRGVVSPGFAGFNLGAVMARKLMKSRYSEQFGQVLDEALLDPDVAATLTKEFNPASVAALRRWAKGYGLAQADEMINLLEREIAEPSEEDETIRAIEEGDAGESQPERSPMRLDLDDPGNQRRGQD